MANDTISFFCPACGIKLTVPSSMAGVVGPCPSCRTQIQAPIPAPPLPVASFVPPVQVPVPVVPPPPPPPQAVAPAVLPIPQVQQVAATPNPIPVYPDPGPSSSQAQPVVLKPEPRNLPNRPHPEVIAKPIPETSRNGDFRVPPPAPLPRHPHKSSLFARVAMLLAFLAAAGALVFGVHHLLNMDRGGDSRSLKVLPEPAPSPPPAETTTQAADSPPTPEPPAPQENPPTLPTPAPDQTPVIEPPPAPPEGLDTATPGVEAQEALEKFLTAKSLAERLPLIETRTPEAELANSCLASPLPPAPLLIPDFQETNGIENLVDFYFIVGFEKGSTPIEKLTVLVRSRGGGEPKIVVDPFLDLFGGRLAAFVSKPSDKAGVFHVIADPVATCLDKKEKPIPEREKKFTLKLLPCENTKEIALAYFGKASELGETFSDVSRGFGLGKAKACTVMLSWNPNKDDPTNPFIEAIQLKALDWNP